MKRLLLSCAIIASFSLTGCASAPTTTTTTTTEETSIQPVQPMQ